MSGQYIKMLTFAQNDSEESNNITITNNVIHYHPNNCNCFCSIGFMVSK